MAGVADPPSVSTDEERDACIAGVGGLSGCAGDDWGDDDKWFAAAHLWDVSIAMRAGFQGAYYGVLEGKGCWEVF
jgi:2-haloacid dehalogenase